MGQRSIRFPDELEARIQAVAVRDDRSFAYVVVRALESALSGVQDTLRDSDGADPLPSAKSSPPVEKEPGPRTKAPESGGPTGANPSPASSRQAKQTPVEVALPKIAPRRTR
jgi:hypothetical protein